MALGRPTHGTDTRHTITADINARRPRLYHVDAKNALAFLWNVCSVVYTARTGDNFHLHATAPTKNTQTQKNADARTLFDETSASIVCARHSIDGATRQHAAHHHIICHKVAVVCRWRTRALLDRVASHWKRPLVRNALNESMCVWAFWLKRTPTRVRCDHNTMMRQTTRARNRFSCALCARTALLTV